ncbi:TPA: molybdopterin molybdotransferase MoeA [Campylobacter jejuni]|nr:molybdopterin molybdotransferase MoeA [Campylobacter jejuni]
MKNIFETLKDLEDQISCLDESELISLEKAKDRILAKDLYARKNLPSFDNAALDGYAFNYADINEALEIKGTIFAGDKNFYTVAKNECYKIMTGAKIPKNADTILMLEDEYIEENKLIIKKTPKQYNAYRYKGEELKKGEILLQKGTKLNDKHIALLASQGLYKIEVIRKIRIGIFSSGNELKEPWQECDEESIYNANALPLLTMLQNASYLGIIKDDFKSTKEALENTNFDLLITSGGASVGEADFMEKALDELGFTPLFKGLKARPARPTKLYRKGENFVLILPGNPMAAYLSCFIFAKKIINLLSGNLDNPLTFYGKMGMDLKLKSGRNNLILGNLEKDIFTPFNENKFGSGMILPLIKSEFLLISEENTSELKKGDEITLLKI